MATRTDLDFDVRWWPFQLNSQAPRESNKLQMYMKKFGMSKEQAMGKADWMRGNFERVGLPFRFTETDLTGNTWDAHRVLTEAYEKGGAAAQDKACESLFQSYFAEGKAPSDPAVLKAAADAAGLDGAVVSDKSVADSKTKEEMARGQRLGVSGVPHFVVYEENAPPRDHVQVGGAQPPQEFVNVFRKF